MSITSRSLHFPSTLHHPDLELSPLSLSFLLSFPSMRTHTHTYHTHTHIPRPPPPHTYSLWCSTSENLGQGKGGQHRNTQAPRWNMRCACSVKHSGHPIRSSWWDFSGGSVVKNPPAKTGDMGSIPGPGGSHMQLSPCTAVVEPLCSRAREPQLLSLQSCDY